MSERLYRNTDDVMVGGVCSGLADYFCTDATWIRLAAAMAFFLSGGLLVCVYVALWIIVPEE